jgi:hypothetical protein
MWKKGEANWNESLNGLNYWWVFIYTSILFWENLFLESVSFYSDWEIDLLIGLILLQRSK